jgi:CheY-like chemotaxis protein
LRELSLATNFRDASGRPRRASENQAKLIHKLFTVVVFFCCAAKHRRESMNNAILLADDSKDDQVIFQTTMKKCGVVNPLVTVGDGHLAITLLNEQKPAPGILFLDLKMPNCDGFEVLRWIQSRPGAKQGILVIVMSALDGVAEVRHAYELGADTFLSKPFTPADMLHLVDTFPGQWMRTAPAATLKPWQHLSTETPD